MLQVMASDERCISVRKEIRQELRRLNFREPEVARIEMLFDQLRVLKQHLERLEELGLSAPRISDRNSFEADWIEMIKVGEAVLRFQRD